MRDGCRCSPGFWPWASSPRCCVAVATRRLGPSTAPVAAGAAVVLALTPAVMERARYVGENRVMMQASAAAHAEREPDLAALVTLMERLQADAPARIFAGLPASWGRRF